MDWYGMSDAALIAELGKRIKSYRLRKKFTQQEIADRAGVSVFTVAQVEKGSAVSFATIIAILRVLRLIENLEMLLPEIKISPIEMLKLKGKTPKRSYKPRSVSKK
ncbi:MAG: helix-turn-helix transcriptional regulator [Bacteroidales bacterium]|nr:helix-turn-helix transcriptional regulator [Bacteroidales bacterium]